VFLKDRTRHRKNVEEKKHDISLKGVNGHVGIYDISYH
jgi:hypothetical protein